MKKRVIEASPCVCLLPPLQDVDASEIKVQVCVYAFDLLYLNGEVRPAAGRCATPHVTHRSLSGLSPLLGLLFASAPERERSPGEEPRTGPECQ